ncbi:MAG: hypothetical protein ACE5KM_17255, partial [Planctomycetaceae bacterium]
MRLPSIRQIGIALTVCAAAGCGTLPVFDGRRAAARRDARDTASQDDDNPFLPAERDRQQGRRRDSTSTDSRVLRRLKEEISHLPAEKRREFLAQLEGPTPPRDEVVRFIRGQLQMQRARETQPPDDLRLTGDDSERKTRYGENRPARDRSSADQRDPARRSPHRLRDAGGGRRSDERYDVSRNRGGAARSLYRDVGYRPDASGRRDARDPSRRDAADSRTDNGFERPAARDRAGSDPQFDRAAPAGARRDEWNPDQPTRLSSDWNDALKKLIALTEARAAEKAPLDKNDGSNTRNQVYLRLLHLMSDNPARAVTVIRDADSTEQQFWRELVWGVFEYLHQKPEFTRSNRAARTIAGLRRAVVHLRTDADLEVRNLEFCRKIHSYGSYDVVGRNEQTGRVQFRAGEQVLLYAEIENYTTERTSEGHHKTRLRSTIELYYAPD